MIVRWNHQYDIQKVLDIIKEFQKEGDVVRNEKEVKNRIKEHVNAIHSRQ
jgi:predicted glycosyltransferase